MRTIIDTDPGIDDAMAFYYAHGSDRTELAALTTIFGNVPAATATRNALWLGDSVGTPYPVHRGADAPRAMPGNPPSARVHGTEGFGDVVVEGVTRAPETVSAAQHLVAEAANTPGTLTICAIGPLTNIAAALDLDEGFVGNLRQLVIMGGSLDAGGNVTAHAEANFWNDPHAAHRVLTAPGGGEITVVGLDVTRQVAFTPAHFAKVARDAPHAGGILARMGDFYLRFYESVTGQRRCFLHDPAALIAGEFPEMFGMEAHRLGVVTQGEAIGAMVRDEGSPRLCRVCTGVDAEAVIARYLDVLARLD